MLRFILLGVLFLMIWRMFKKMFNPMARPAKEEQKKLLNEMVKCDNCNTYIYKDFAKRKGDAWICKTECTTPSN